MIEKDRRAATKEGQRSRFVVERSKTPVWNIPLVNGFIGNKIFYGLS